MAGCVLAIIGLGLVGQIAAQLLRATGGRTAAIDPAAERVALVLWFRQRVDSA